jgi:glutamyl/glutaminyl-tRNA synthetase
MMNPDYSQPPFTIAISATSSREAVRDQVAEAMQRAGLLEEPAPPAALRWVETFVDAYGERLETAGDALPYVRALRGEAIVVPAVDLERLRNRQVLFFLDTIGQYVDAQPELRDLPLEHDVAEIADEFGIAREDALWAIRMALFGESEGPPLELLFPLLGHDRIMIRIGAISSHLLHGRGLEPIRYGPDGKPFETLAGKKPS